jgi:hypothetical protein
MLSCLGAGGRGTAPGWGQSPHHNQMLERHPQPNSGGTQVTLQHAVIIPQRRGDDNSAGVTVGAVAHELTVLDSLPFSWYNSIRTDG